ncbi:flavonoid 3',5'-hydroxylase 1-like [Mangifera indica]|uniref:flavonoid 3',5'-hydroxylase 1-like n=1 Tax=Mangifera indica TaxID=29780 RepID=UPI001CF9CE17|nr:flavonoid 3',5'-hydroxylase 1-like [Mangifera indica]
MALSAIFQDSFSLKKGLVAVLVFIITRYVVRCLFGKSRPPLPPGPWGFPIVGALPLIGSKPHVSFAKMAKKYGPIMYLKFGSLDMVVASTPEAAKAFLKTHDLNFSSRPIDTSVHHFAYDGQDMVNAEYGPRWTLLRKVCNTHMFGSKALEDWAHIRVSEVGLMLQDMLKASRKGEPVLMPTMLSYLTANVIGQVVLSRRVFASNSSESNEFKVLVVEMMKYAAVLLVKDIIPALGLLEGGTEKKMRELHIQVDAMITKMIAEHIATSQERKGRPDLLDVILTYRDKPDGERLSTENIKGLLLNLFVAGTDASSSAVEWALTELLKKPTIFKKAQEEMDQVIGRGRRLEESDIPKLPYLQAICKETLRKHPSTPLNLPRLASEDCVVNGYFIPKNTRLQVNIYAIGRDPDVWENPLEFTPERFLTEKNKKIDPRGNDFELIPFGAGRRICAGVRMGMVQVEYVLGSLIHAFDWKLPEGVKELDMEEIFGLTLHKAVPLTAMVSPRLAPHAYV